MKETELVKITIRPAVPEDATEIVRMARALSREEGQPETPFDEPTFRCVGFGSERAFDPIVAEAEGHLIAYAFSTTIYDTQLAAPTREIIDLFVAASAHRMGVASRLLDCVRATAEANNEAAVLVRTASHNQAARAFYAAAGGKLDDVTIYFWGDD